MSNLLTIAQYEAIFGTQSATDRTLITTYLIPAASAAVERFVDRILGLTNYIEWTKSPNCFGVYFPLQYPLVTLYSVNRTDVVVTAQNTATSATVIIVQADKLILYNPLTNTNTSYLYATYPSLVLLLAQLAVDCPTLICTATVDTSFATTLLRPATIPIPAGNTSNIEGAVIGITGHIEQDRIVYGGEFQGSWTSQDFPGYPTDAGFPQGNVGGVCLVYSAGLDPLPYDLIVTVANIIRDMLGVEKGKKTTGMESESVAQYSYKLAKGVDLDALVYSKYAMALSQFRRIIL